MVTSELETQILKPILNEYEDDELVRFARNDWDTEPSDDDMYDFKHTDTSLNPDQSLKENICDFAQVYPLYLVRIFTKREVEAGRLSWEDAMECMGEVCLAQYIVALERYQGGEGKKEEVIYYMGLMAGYDCLRREAAPSELIDNPWSDLKPEFLGTQPRKPKTNLL